jgi:hypothetical protein
MKPGGDYQVVLKRSHRKYIPKKLLQHQKIPVSDRYTFNASVWIADTPESNFKPTVNLTIQHNGDKVRFCFADAVTMCLAMKDLTHFLDKIFTIAHEKHCLAVKEFLEFHQSQRLPSLDDYTVYTVIQGKGKKEKRIRCRIETGEILEEAPLGVEKAV